MSRHRRRPTTQRQDARPFFNIHPNAPDTARGGVPHDGILAAREPQQRQHHLHALLRQCQADLGVPHVLVRQQPPLPPRVQLHVLHQRLRSWWVWRASGLVGGSPSSYIPISTATHIHTDIQADMPSMIYLEVRALHGLARGDGQRAGAGEEQRLPHRQKRLVRVRRLHEAAA